MTDAKIVSGDEHPSGLRDAIDKARKRWTYDAFLNHDANCWAMIEEEVTAWLSVVSEDEIEAAARAAYGAWKAERVHWPVWHAASPHTRRLWTRTATAALAASRGVLLPKEPQT